MINTCWGQSGFDYIWEETPMVYNLWENYYIFNDYLGDLVNDYNRISHRPNRVKFSNPETLPRFLIGQLQIRNLT